MKYTNLFIAFLPIVFGFSSFAQVQNSLHFDGYDDAVITNFKGISGNNPRTVEAMIKANNTSNAHAIVQWGDWTQSGPKFSFDIAKKGVVEIEFGLNSGSANIFGSIFVCDSQWHHVAVTYDPDEKYNFHIYVDGQLDTATNTSLKINTAKDYNLRIGFGLAGSKKMSGNIDEVRIWNYARTQAQIDSFKDQEICPNQRGLVAYYRFNQGTADSTNSGSIVLPDLSGNGYHGKLNNFSLSGDTSNWVHGPPIVIGPDTGISIDTSFSVTSCYYYIAPSGRKVTSSQKISDTIYSVQGCDSVMNINVTINRSSFVGYSLSGCDSVVSPNGRHTWRTSGIYRDTLTNALGCDSIERYIVDIYSTYDEVTEQHCAYYISPSKKHTWSTSGVYLDTLTNAFGCDSILEIDLTISPQDSTELTVQVCGAYTTPGGRVLESSGIYYDTLLNSMGCDTIVTIDLTIKANTDTVLTANGCDSAVSESGLNTWYQSGLYKEILVNKAGCDSILEYYVNVFKPRSSSIVESACNSYTSPSGKVLTSTGIYKDTIRSSQGCDSIITIQLSMTKVTARISLSDGVFTAQPSNSSYQWLDCDSSYQMIPQETAQTFTPKKYGAYAVEVMRNDCADTSECLEYEPMAVHEPYTGSLIEIYPNPTTGMVYIKLNSAKASVRVLNALGQVLSRYEIQGGLSSIEIDQPSGIYYMEFEIPSEVVLRKKLIKR